jgi:membrane-bound serine protease (ClpP class)
MNILLIPEVAYLILVVGFLLAILALMAPGTGFIELFALSMLVLAGYSASQLSFNVWALVLLVIGVFPFLLAVRKSNRWGYLVIALLALAIGSAYLFRADTWWQPGVNPLLALVVSLLAGGLVWVVVHKGMEAMSRRPTFNQDKVIGAKGETKTEVYHDGIVYAGGENWSACSRTPIPARTQIMVVAREGFVVEVEPLIKTT